MVARGQQPDRVRRIGVLIGALENDSEVQARVTAFVNALQNFGWTASNVKIDYRWAGSDLEKMEADAKELIALAPDLILASGPAAVSTVMQQTRTVPIIFVQVTDPVGSNFVSGLADPGGNVTGFASYEFSMGSKWLELLKDIAPRVSRVLVMQHAESPTWPGQLHAVEAAAPSFGVQVIPAGVHDEAEIDRSIEGFAGDANGGLIVMPANVTVINRERIVALTQHYKLPAIYPFRYFSAIGGLISYGIDLVDVWRRAATYADRILHGAKPTDLPVQQAVRFELVINLKTAGALGLEVPQSLLAGADEVIE
jgi:putative tryptophan/tyrosine transport system substrate-binding protein